MEEREHYPMSGYIMFVVVFLARSEILRFIYNGFTQKKPFFFTVPIYTPNKTNTLELFGLIKKKPGKRRIAINNNIKANGFLIAISPNRAVTNIRNTTTNMI